MAVNIQFNYITKYMVFEYFIFNLPAFLTNVIQIFLALNIRQGKGNSWGFLFQMIKTKPEILHGREGCRTEVRTPLFFCFSFPWRKYWHPNMQQ